MIGRIFIIAGFALGLLCGAVILAGPLDGVFDTTAGTRDTGRSDPLALTVFQHETHGREDAPLTRAVIGFNTVKALDVRAMTGVEWPSIQPLEPLGDGTYELEYGPETTDGDGEYDQYEVTILIAASGGERHWLTIHRQSQAELEDAFGFGKSDGYSIIADTTLSLPGEDFTGSYELDHDYAQLPEGLPQQVAPDGTPSELWRAAEAMVWLNQQGLTYSPREASDNFVSLADELTALRDGETGVQCGDYRLVWTHMALDMGLSVRWIDLATFVRTPDTPDATPYSHAATEVWTESDGWIYFDPWFNFAFQRNGEWLSAAEIRATLRENPAQLERVRPATNLSRTGRYGLGDRPLVTEDVLAPPMSFYRNYFVVVGVISLE